MLKIFPKPVIMILLFSLTACASGPKVDMKRFSEAQTLLNKLPSPPMCQVVPAPMLTSSLPVDTSNGKFSTLKDVGEQDGAVSAHWPILEEKRKTLAQTVVLNEKTNTENRADYDASIEDIKAVFDKVIADEEKGKWYNPFD